MSHDLLGRLARLGLAVASSCVLVGPGPAQAQTPTPAAATLRVLATSPTGPVSGNVTQATIRFSEPMIALGAADADQVGFVTVTPAVPVRFHWPDTNVLVISPVSGRFPLATSVEVRVDAAATSVAGRRLAAPHVVRFSTATPRLLYASVLPPRAPGPALPGLDISLSFDQAVRADDVPSHVEVAIDAGSQALPHVSAEARAWMARVDTAGLKRFDAWIADLRRQLGPSRPLRVSVPPGGRDGTQVVLRLAETPPRGARVIVTATGLASPEGPLRGLAPERRVLPRPPLFTVTGPDCGGRCDPRFAALTTSLPLADERTLRTAIAVTDITDPGAPRLLSPAASGGGSRYASVHTLRDLGYALVPGRRYAARVEASLTAHTGEVLGAPWMGVFDVGLPLSTAGLGTTDSMAVWEGANGPRVPVLTRSLLDVRTWATAVKSPRLIAAPTPVRSRAPVVTAVPTPVDGSEQETLVDISPALSPQGTGFVQLWVESGREAPNTAGGVVVRPQSFQTASLVQVTNIGLSVRGSTGALAILATRLDTGAPIPDAAITVFDDVHEVLWRGRTDGDGLVMARGSDSARSDRSAATVLADKEGDASFVRVGYAWPPASDSGLTGVVITDRGVYRPGDTVEVKAWLRLATPRGLEPLPAGTPVTLTWSSEGTTVRALATTVTAAGGAAWTLPVPVDAKVDGYQDLSVARTGQERDRVDGTFLIKAVRPVEFWVDLGAELSASLDRPVIEARLQARDLAGIALGDAPVAWTLARATPTTLPVQLVEDAAFAFSASDDQTEDAIDDDDEWPLPLERAASLDAQGETRERFLLPDGLRGRGQYLVAAQVRDTSSQVQGQRIALNVPADAYIGIGQDEPPADASTPVTPAIRLVARTPAGAQVPGIAVTVRLYRDGDADKNPVVLHTTTGSSPVRVALPAALEGENILVIARADDARLAIMPGRFWGRVTPRPGTAGPTTPDTPILSLDRETYRPGDRARVTITSPVAGATALLTLERGDVLEARVVRLSGTTAAVDVPVGDSVVSGLQAAVTLIQGRRSPCCDANRNDPGRPTTISAAIDVVLDQAGSKLAVAIEAPRQARPGGRATVRVRVRDDAQRPVQGEVTLWAVDEGLLALTEYTLVDLQRAMYHRDAGGPWLLDTRSLLLGRRLPQWLGDVIQTSTARAGSLTEQLSAQAEGADLDVRRDFRPLAFWQASMTTDADGVAQIEATLPDTLTTYRIMAIAADAAARYGSATAPLTVTRPVMTRPAVPRVLTRLDRASIRATVAASGLAGSGSVRLESLTPLLLAVSGGAERAVTVTDGGRAVAAFDVEARGEGVARIRLTATIGGDRDVVERTIAIVDRSVPEVSAAVGSAAPEAIETIRLPAGIEADGGALDLELASTMLVGLNAASDYVVRYGYACAEQSASRALALILRGALASPTTTPPAGGHGGEEARRALERLERYRCDGGYAYWKGNCDGPPSPYLTAYVLFVRQTAARYGHPIDAAGLARDAADLEALLARPRAAPARLDDHAWRAFAVKVLADGGRRPEAVLTALYARRDELPIFALAHLLDAQTAVEPSSPRVAELRRRIRNALTVGTTAHVEERALTPYAWCWPSNTKSTAIVLDVLSRRGGASAEEAHPIVSWLLGARRHGIWGGTQENIWVLAGLAAYRQAFEIRGDADMTASATLAATELVKSRLDARQPTASTRLAMPALAAIVAPGGSGRLAIRSSGRAPMFYATRLDVRRPARDAAPLEHGIVLRRSYLPVVRGVEGAPATSFRVGDLVRVVLTVRLPESRTFVAVTDALAGGFEAVDTTLATAAPDAEAAGDHMSGGWWDRFDRIERYDDRVDLFATSLKAGEHTVSYLARATTPGTFLAAGTRAEAMYEPEVAGRTAATTITVEP
jgi:alpha-2-macroglobulin